MATKAPEESREHERIDLQLHTRMWLEEKHRGKPIVFEGYSRTRNLAIGGTFLESTFLLPVGFPVNLEMSLEGGEILSARGEVAHAQQDENDSGMGVTFTGIDAENRERLLRFFVSDRIRDFYEERFSAEFPHLTDAISLQDIALIINLWEDRDGRIDNLKK
jgi:hypothetical protein